jgi:hypothetical protein
MMNFKMTAVRWDYASDNEAIEKSFLLAFLGERKYCELEIGLLYLFV